MIKAGSIAYAIFICVVVGIFCYSLLLMSGYSRIHQDMLAVHTELLSNNASAQAYFLKHIDEIEGKSITKDIFENEMLSTGKIKPWGFYKVLVTTSVFKNDTIERSALIGQQSQDNLALYLTDSSKPLFMVDKAKITGNAFLPKAGIKAGYITSNAFKNIKFLEGNKNTSKISLPKIKDIKRIYDNNSIQEISMHEVKDKKLLYNSFESPTLIIENIGVRLSNKNLSGNIIITSKDSIFIKNDNVLQDVIIQAPKVVFESGFTGAVQVRAERIVELQKKVILRYPSSILLNSGNADKREVIIGNESKIIGGVVIYDATKGLDKMITIAEDAEVIGDVYCSGKLQLKGKVVGTVYTSKFYLKTAAAIYDNYIKDGVIDRKSLPDEFVRIALFGNESDFYKAYEVIKPI